MTTRPALTVIDGGRDHALSKLNGPSASATDLARALARRDFARMMAAANIDSPGMPFKISPLDRGAES